LSALQLHPWALIVVDEDATAGRFRDIITISNTFIYSLDTYTYVKELHVKTVKYFKSIERVQDEVEKTQAELKAKGKIAQAQVGSLE